MLANDPGRVTRDLTIGLEPVLAAGLAQAVPLLRTALGVAPGHQVPVESVLEWGIRLSLSLVLMPSPLVDLTEPASVRTHLESLFRIGAPTSISS